MLKKLLFVVVFLSLQFTWAQRPPLALSDSTSVSVLTCDRGNELYSLYGHTALRVVDYKQNLDVVFNYGTFDFAAPNFALRFVKGDLQYFVSVSSYADFLYNYQHEARAVKEQFLHLNASEKQKLWSELVETLTTDKRYYTYKFIDRNCTTMVKDILELATGKSIEKVGPIDHSYRDLIYPEFRYHFWEKLGTQLLFGTKVDESATEIFLPEELFTSLAASQWNGQSAVSQTTTPLDLPTAEPEKISFFNTIWFYIALLTAIVLVPWDSVRKGYVLLIGVVGVFFLVAGIYSLHSELQYNWQVLLCNPLWIAIVFTAKKPKLQSQLLALIPLCIVVYALLVFNKIHAGIVAPMCIANVVIAWKMYRKNNLLAAVK